MTGSSILRTVAPRDGRPTTWIRQAGDDQVLVEYDDTAEEVVSLNFRVHALLQELAQHPVDGVLETSTGLRSVMVTFDPEVIGRDRLMDELSDREGAAVDLDSLVVDSRLLELPIAFDDETTREAVNRYRITTRMDAPNVRDRDNIDYIVQYNGFQDREAFFARFLSTVWWTASIGYFPGLPSLLALDPLTQLSAPKYNPTRMWTPEGAVGIGGSAIVLYPMESPGAYQLFGRTLPIWRPVAGDADVTDFQVFRPCDRVRFTRVTESELRSLRLQVFEGSYPWRITEERFVVADYLAEVERTRDAAATVAEHRRVAAAGVEIP
ncbi:5-oxoprolinase subunit B family protein [Nocardioides albidus]|nr:carboxyltransferase domain-containing protein [Nocardioides albidus]